MPLSSSTSSSLTSGAYPRRLEGSGGPYDVSDQRVIRRLEDLMAAPAPLYDRLAAVATRRREQAQANCAPGDEQLWMPCERAIDIASSYAQRPQDYEWLFKNELPALPMPHLPGELHKIELLRVAMGRLPPVGEARLYTNSGCHRRFSAEPFRRELIVKGNYLTPAQPLRWTENPCEAMRWIGNGEVDGPPRTDESTIVFSSINSPRSRHLDPYARGAPPGRCLAISPPDAVYRIESLQSMQTRFGPVFNVILAESATFPPGARLYTFRGEAIDVHRLRDRFGAAAPWMMPHFKHPAFSIQPPFP